jgi:hypothetical protein
LPVIATAFLVAGCSGFGLAGMPSEPGFTTGVTPSGHPTIYLTKPGHYVFQLGHRVRVGEPIHCPSGAVLNVGRPGSEGLSVNPGMNISVSGAGVTRISCRAGH